ncbi:hypothetical protein ACFQ0B_66995 [Nonomuraea thailandensis]
MGRPDRGAAGQQIGQPARGGVLLARQRGGVLGAQQVGTAGRAEQQRAAGEDALDRLAALQRVRQVVEGVAGCGQSAQPQRGETSTTSPSDSGRCWNGAWSADATP